MAKIPQKWAGFLTPELRHHFNSIGEELVRRDISQRRFVRPENHQAALAWLAEKRADKRLSEDFKIWLYFLGAVGVLIVAAIAIL
jgi:hypothetical protein